jgi:hypothetical protein
LAEHTSPFKPPSEKRSPFPDPSLPQAGESLGDAAMNLWLDKFFFYFLAALMFGAVAITEWMSRLLNSRVSPWVWTVPAVAAGVMATWRWFWIKPQMDALRQGIRGERAVGRMLEDFRRLGYEVFHDIPGDGFNIDHALIGPGGVFAIETKTISKRPGPEVKVDYDGTRVLIDGHAPDRDPVAQAAAGADYLRDLLKGMTDRDVPVRAVVLFPKWFITKQPPGCRVWVLNEKALLGFLKNEPRKLSPEDVALFANRLTLHLSKE